MIAEWQTRLLVSSAFTDCETGGARVGILALDLYSAGALGKLYAESLENVPLSQ
jgi:ABC-type phosphate/phosphonate transport system permease subunit